MKKTSKNILLIILVCVFVFLLAFYIIREIIASRDIYVEPSLRDEEYNMVPKVYDINEYSKVEISDQQMTQIYLNLYINDTKNNLEKSYNSLNKEYREAKFSSFDEYTSYVNSNRFSNNLSRYYVNYKYGDKVYYAYDSNNNLYIFKTNGVMQYEVYLDDYTVEI